MPVAYKWKPFSDLPQDISSLTDGELEPLHRVWLEEKNSLKDAGILETFLERLNREWAIETGIIERVYDLDRGITQTLIKRGIDSSFIVRESNGKSPEKIARIIQSHREALEGIFDFVKGDRELTTGYINQLHAVLLQDQDTFEPVDQFGRFFAKPLEKGKYKIAPNSPTQHDGSIHEYCPPEQVASEMDRMIELYAEHSRRKTPAEVEAGWLHHVFTQIHPYTDGNGRVARALASLVFLKAGWFPVVIQREDRERYFDALQAADEGDMRALIALFARVQRLGLFEALDAINEIGPAGQSEATRPRPQTVEQAIEAVREVLESKGQISLKKWLKAKDNAEKLSRVSYDRLQQLSNTLYADIAGKDSIFQFPLSPGNGMTDWNDIISAAKTFGYAAGLQEYHLWSVLGLRSERPADIVITIHSVGGRFRGLLAAIVLFRSAGEKFRAASDDVFQINYAEDLAHIEGRFRPWLEEGLTKALDLWRRTL